MNPKFIVPIKKELEGQAKLVLKSVGLPLLKSKILTFDAEKAAIEQAAMQPGVGSDKYDKIGYFGLPVFDTVKLISPRYTDNDGKTIPSQQLVLDIPLIEVHKPKHLVITQIAGRNSSVKEYMSEADAEVTIRGTLASEYATLAPFDPLKNLSFMCACPEALQVESNFLQYLGIFSLATKVPKFSQVEGTRNIIKYEIEFLSDEPVELQ